MSPQTQSIMPAALPLTITAVTAFAAMFIDLKDKPNPRLQNGVVVAGLLLAALATIVPWNALGDANQSMVLWGGVFTFDKLAGVFTALAAITGALILMFSINWLENQEQHPGEYITLVPFAVLGLILACSTTELLTFFIAFEIISLPLYVMAAWGRFDLRSSEAGFKYFITGAMSSAIMLYGISLVFGTTGTTVFDLIGKAYELVPESRHAFALGALMIIVGLCFKIAAAPFHLWAPDVYQGAPSPAATFISTAPKATMIAFMLRVCWGPLDQMGMDFTLEKTWVITIAAIAIVSMLWGNLTALVQKDIKRLMAYSGIAQIGYTLLGVMAASRNGALSEGSGAAIYYIVMYCFANMAAWAVIIIYGSKIGSSRIADYRGLAKRSPFMAFTLLIAFFSLAGTPPLAGFIGKFFLFKAVWTAQSAWWWVVLLGIANSVISLYYYFGVLKPVYFSEPNNQEPVAIPRAAQVAMVVCLLVVTVVGLCPQALGLATNVGASLPVLYPSNL